MQCLSRNSRSKDGGWEQKAPPLHSSSPLYSSKSPSISLPRGAGLQAQVYEKNSHHFLSNPTGPPITSVFHFSYTYIVNNSPVLLSFHFFDFIINKPCPSSSITQSIIRLFFLSDHIVNNPPALLSSNSPITQSTTHSFSPITQSTTTCATSPVTSTYCFIMLFYNKLNNRRALLLRLHSQQPTCHSVFLLLPLLGQRGFGISHGEKCIKSIVHFFLIVHGIIKTQGTIESHQKKIVFGKY